MVCVLDFKRDVGLWHGILAVSMHFIFHRTKCQILYVVDTPPEVLCY